MFAFEREKKCCLWLVHTKSSDRDGLAGRGSVGLIEAKNETLCSQYGYFK
jgi:hypothetical protein